MKFRNLDIYDDYGMVSKKLFQTLRERLAIKLPKIVY
ncbi:hypothetical protein AAUPMG_02922 [Pasteurella multocida subsp. multocida str. Anand1_goat]|nr:hypothetical protein AAUPMG_02922 [Pasteurella multocida subsp. multocida str. Anand1_goat]